MHNPVRELQHYGQSVWLDYIRRSLFTSGELQRLIDEDGLCGVTSNPSIFEKAIAASADYRDALARMPPMPSSRAVYEHIVVRDVQDAADLLVETYTRTSKRDGYVSLEVSPLLAHDTSATVEEARRLWQAVSRPNIMIKVPATTEGISAVGRLISEGINVNVTLIFSLGCYDRVVEAYLAGLEQRCANQAALGGIASVASFFVSRIDSEIDSIISHRMSAANTPRDRELLRGLLGTAAIASAKLAYQRYREVFESTRWLALAARGAQTQRLLWASTATKNSSYRDVLYLEELVGPDTVSTVPPATLDAFRDHGCPRASLCEDVESALETLSSLARAGIRIDEVADSLLERGVQLFTDSFTKLLTAVGRSAGEDRVGEIARLTCSLPGNIATALNAAVHDWRTTGKIRKLWSRDASLWTGSDEARWLGWLGIADGQLAHIDHLRRIAEAVNAAGFEQVLLLGMGGSSLGPEVFRTTFGKRAGFPELHVLDSTDPGQVLSFERQADRGKTLYIVSSKSGGTLEPMIFKQYFFEHLKLRVGETEAGNRFIAITDPGSKLQGVAQSERFRHIFCGDPTIGGRYSVLSDFGLVPAAIMGVDVPKLLDRAEEMVHACTPSVPIDENAAAMLGLILGVAHNAGRNKLTLITSPDLGNFGAWLEQLVAESTGKGGKGIIPVDREAPGDPAVYGDDRLFVYVRLNTAPDLEQDRGVEALLRAEHPVVRICVDDIYDLGAEFFRWELATAVAGAVIGVHPFDQPDVEASKVATHRLTAQFERTGKLPEETPILSGSARLFADERNAIALQTAARGSSMADYLRAHLDRIRPHDYFAVLAYIAMNGPHEAALQSIKKLVRDRKKVATCLGFGPRFLHSTGQAYKGGPNSGVFLQITARNAVDVPVPGQKFTFGVVAAAQALGDFQVLAARRRRVLRVDLGEDVLAGLADLDAAIRQALVSNEDRSSGYGR